MTRLGNRHWRRPAGVAVVVALLLGAVGGAQEILRLSRNVPGDSKPIVLHANEISTWTEGNLRIILLKGKVLVEHGIVHARMDQGVVWVDQERYKRTGVMHADVFADGNVQLESGRQKQKGPSAFLDLNTRGEIKIKSQQGKVVQQPQPLDPLYQRAQVARDPSQATNQPGAIQRTSALEPAPPTDNKPPPGPVMQPAQNPPPPQLPRLNPPQPPSPSQGSPQGGPPPPGPTATPGMPDTAPVPELSPVPLPGPTAAVPVSPPPPHITPAPILDGPLRQISIAPRTANDFQIQDIPLANGEHAVVVAGGVILNVRTDSGDGLLDIEADRMVLWTRESPQQVLGNLRRPEGQTTRQIEFYLSGNVEIRERQGKEERTLRANDVYYDVGRNVAVAMQADLEYIQPGLADPVHLKAEELIQLSPTNFRAVRAEVFSSRLPSDPGLKVYVADATLDQRKVPLKNIFGGPVVDRRTGQPLTEDESLFRGRNVFFEVEDVPFFYFPYVQGDARDPLGPLENIGFGQDNIFGTQFYTTWNVYDLLGIQPRPGTRWSFLADYLSDRGPALGTNFDYAGSDMLGIQNRYQGLVKAYGIYDQGVDDLGGGRGKFIQHPLWRGRFQWRQNLLELPYGFTLQTQTFALSDKNFYEQYWKQEFDNDINAETFTYLKQQQDNWAWTILGEGRIRNWVTETEWLPRLDGHLIGQSFFDIFTYNARASAGYAQLKITDLPPPPVVNTDQNDSTGRFDLWQELGIPLDLGAVKIVPYGILDLTAYTNDLNDQEQGRLYGGGGVRASMPFSRLFPEVQSDLFNLNGINHKILLSGNYYNVGSNVAFANFPQLDRLDDDATDQARRDITPVQPALNPANGIFLQQSPIFNLQQYAIRRLVDNRVDTLDAIQIFQADLRQRWQTKRGYPGQQHIVDWMMLDVSSSFFPNPARDNYDERWAFFEYDWLWNVGDRTALMSSGWWDPFDHGARVYTMGASLNRPDRTNFFVGYRQIDPVESKAVTGSVSYIFSPKYAMTAGTTYDFGTKQNQSTQLSLTRIGSDLQISFGVYYNAMQDNFGVRLEVVPNLLAQTGARLGGLPLLGATNMGVGR